MSLEVLKPGLHTSIQDGGRVGFQDKGIPKSGFMDTQSAHLANLLVNNPPNTSLIEMSFLGATFKVHKTIEIAICGACMGALANNTHIPINKKVLIKKGTVLTFSQATRGVYTYLAVSGSFMIPTYLGSTATYIPAGIGGQQGKLLKKGDKIPIKSISIKTNCSFGRVKPIQAKTTLNLTCLKGPEYHCFSIQDLDSFFTNTYTISKNSNRIGTRLQGTSLELTNVTEIISSGIVKGTVQITKGGLPIVLMADAPTTGGYLRIVNLTRKACNILSQLPVGKKVQFQLMQP